MLLSVVLPAYEADVELRRCVDSVRIACGAADICQIVIVMPQAGVEKARALLPGELIVVESRPSIYAAMNDGIAASTGEYLYFLGKDDIVLAGFREVLAVLENAHPSVMFADVYWGSKGVYRGRPSRLRMLARNLCHQGIIYSRDAIRKHGPYLRRMRVEADKLLNLKVLADQTLSPKFFYLSRPIAWYAGTGFSVRSSDPLFRKLYPMLLRRYVGRWAEVSLVAVRRVLGR